MPPYAATKLGASSRRYGEGAGRHGSRPAHHDTDEEVSHARHSPLHAGRGVVTLACVALPGLVGGQQQAVVTVAYRTVDGRGLGTIIDNTFYVRA